MKLPFSLGFDSNVVKNGDDMSSLKYMVRFGFPQCFLPEQFPISCADLGRGSEAADCGRNRRVPGGVSGQKTPTGFLPNRALVPCIGKGPWLSNRIGPFQGYRWKNVSGGGTHQIIKVLSYELLGPLISGGGRPLQWVPPPSPILLPIASRECR